MRNISDIRSGIIKGQSLASRSDKYSMTSVSADNYKKTIKADGREYELVLAKIIPNASETISDIPEGQPIISFLLTKDMTSAETIILMKGRYQIIRWHFFWF